MTSPPYLRVTHAVRSMLAALLTAESESAWDG